MQAIKLSSQNAKLRASYPRVKYMKRNHLANKPITFKDRSDLLLSTEATYPDFRAKTIPYLSNVPEKAIADLMGKTKTIRYIRKQPIDSECAKPDSLVIVFSGNAKVISLYDGSCKGAMIRVEEPQSDFGNIALITDRVEIGFCDHLRKDRFRHHFKK
jgi:hypothetical protein